MGGSTIHFFSRHWPVFYEDNHLLVLYKPAGLLMQGDHTGDLSLMDLGKSWIKTRHQKPGNVFLGLVHRLDRPVAGVALLCRTSKASKRLSEQFRTHGLKKRYLAVVHGRPPRKTGELVHFLDRSGSTSRVTTQPTAQSREAMLSYRVLDTDNFRSLIQINLFTGRHHQIRVQFGHLGFPVLGDLRYGAPGPLPQKQIALYANQLSIHHPTRGTALTFDCSPPRGWPWPNAGNAGESPPWNWMDLKHDVLKNLKRDMLV